MPETRAGSKSYEEPVNSDTMDDRVEVMEGELTRMKKIIEELQIQAGQHQTTMNLTMELMRKEAANNTSKMMELVTRSFDKRQNEEGEGSSGGKKTESAKEPSQNHGGVKNLEGDELTEFRQSLKKIELPSFNGEDPAGWISRVEIYFRVQETSEKVKVNLAQLCMDGGTIHFFNSLLHDYDDLTWEDLKKELLDRYGGLGEGSVVEQDPSLTLAEGFDDDQQHQVRKDSLAASA